MCYRPLFVFNQFGHLERCALRPGNVHSAEGWEEVLKPVTARYADRHLMRFFRPDAAFAIPELYEMLEAENFFYAIRLRSNRKRLDGSVQSSLEQTKTPIKLAATFKMAAGLGARWPKHFATGPKSLIEAHSGLKLGKTPFYLGNVGFKGGFKA